MSDDKQEATILALRRLIAELTAALDLLGDAIDDPEFEDLIRRGKEAGR